MAGSTLLGHVAEHASSAAQVRPASADEQAVTLQDYSLPAIVGGVAFLMTQISQDSWALASFGLARV